jgi:membrane-associated phospholipid phosphatase
MPAETVTTTAHSPARTPTSGELQSLVSFPTLDEEPRGVGRRLRSLPLAGHPFWAYVCFVLVAFALIAALSIAAGLLVTQLVLRIHGVAADDEGFVRFLARHRSGGLTDASLVGSIMAGGVVLPIIAGLAALTAAVARHWRLAGFLLFALAVESASYRTTTLFIHRHRPEVHRLENLPVNASYPSGHTAASIAVYCGIAFLLTSRISNLGARICIWTVATLIPVFVAFSRMYRGMHHPLDVAGGVVIGVAALTAMIFVSRAAHVTSTVRRREPT